MFKRHSDTNLFLAKEESGACVIAFYLLEDNRDSETRDPENIDLQESWESCAGYYLFFNIKEIPEDRDTFEREISRFLAEKLMGEGPEHTGFLWLIYNDTSIEKEIDAIETKAEETDAENTNVVVTEEKLLDFGGYQLPFGKDTPIVFEKDGASYTGFIFQYPPEPLNLCPSDADLPVPSDGVHLTFIGPRRGCFECKCLIGDYYSQERTSWHVGIRYAIKVGEGLAQQFYPIFDLRDGRRPLLKMCWDLADHLNPDRTFLEFLSKSVKLVPDGEQECKFKLKIPEHPEIIPSYFRTVTGEVIGLAPQRGSTQPARLVFEIWEKKDPPTTSRYYLVPSGRFELILLDVDCKKGHTFTPITSADKKTEFPSQFMCGMSGLESVQFIPRDDIEDGEGNTTRMPGESIVFFPRQPAYVPKFPVILTKGKELQLPNNLDLIQMEYLTAWISFAGTRQAMAYFSQPEATPLYTAKDNDQKDRLLTLFEPVATPLPLTGPSPGRSFPVAPLAGAKPVSNTPGPRAAFLRSFESQIVGPWRRDVIRRTFNNSAGDTTGAEDMTAVTPQGLKATVKVEKDRPLKLGETVKAEVWSELLLARPKGTNNTLKFSNLDSTLQAAFQSNQLFLVATKEAHFQGFASKVRIGDWEFDLKPEKNAENIVIFKFSPGKLRERLQDPQSWTNPKDFNGAADSNALSLLAKRLSDFIKEVDEAVEKGDDQKKADYKPLSTILDQERWAGILGLNVYINSESLPIELKALTAGIKPGKFFAKHLAIETGTIEYVPEHSLGPKECSLFGLIDYTVGPTEEQAQTQDADFVVTRLRSVFRNGELKDFECTAELTLLRLFGEKVESGPGEEPKKIGKKISVIGTRERHEGRDRYSLKLAPNSLGEVPLGTSRVIEHVRLDRAIFDLSLNEREQRYTLRFSFWGAIKFHELKSGDAVFDLFSYQALPFGGLAAQVSFVSSKMNERTVGIDLSRLTLDGTSKEVKLRPKSFVKRFPMKLQRFYTSQSAEAPKNDGYVPVKTLLGNSETDAPIFGLDFTLNLGTLGEFAANAGIAIGLMLVWSPRPDIEPRPEGKLGVLLKFPGAGPAPSDLLSMQGVVKLRADTYELKLASNTKGDVTRNSWVLLLNGMALRILGIGFPRGNRPKLGIFGAPYDPQDNAAGDEATEAPLGWYGVYKK
jgi:hypothetical protein